MHPNHIAMFGKPEEPNIFECREIDFKDDCVALFRGAIEHIDVIAKYKYDKLHDVQKIMEDLVGEFL